MVAADDRADIDRNDVAIPEDPLAGNTVNDLFVDRRADPPGESVMTKKRASSAPNSSKVSRAISSRSCVVTPGAIAASTR